MRGNPQPSLIWLQKTLVSKIILEATEKVPNETGGVLIGYWATEFREAVITDLVGPGPQAIHKRTSFSPDGTFHTQQIARQYRDSNRAHTYLGDWHTHPNSANGIPSWKDKRTLRRISAYAPARAPVPIMGILTEKPEWKLHIVAGDAQKAWAAHLRGYSNADES